MNRQEKLEFLKSNPVFWSRLGFGYDPPLKDDNGRPLVFTRDLSHDGKYHSDLAKKGIKIHTSILHLGWMGVSEFDYSLTDAVLDEVFKNDDIYYIPRIKLNVPVDWCYENPEDILVYYEGSRTAEEIRALVDTPKHDWFGYTAPNGYYKAGDFVDTRPNVGGVIARQSFSSEKWLHDAGYALEKLIDRIENGKYADRIFGYHVSFGVSGEAILWGRADCHYGDYGIRNTANFYEWAERKYGSKEALSEAWEGDFTLPNPDERYHRFDHVSEFMRKDRIGRISRDMDEFTSDSCASAIEFFSDIIRRKAPEKIVGAFYGYFIHTDNPNYAGHLALERLLAGDAVDFFAAPKSYYRCGYGQPGGEMCAAESVNRKKLWVDEADNRTHLASDDVAEWVCRDMSQTRWVMWRELSKNISHDSGFWWMDLGGGWLNSPEIADEIEEMLKVSSYLRTLEHKSCADMLILLDEKSFYQTGVSKNLREGFMEDFICEVRKSGIVADVYRMADIREIDLSKYKLISFAYTFDISSEDREYLKKNISPDTFLAFNWAAGICRNGECDFENAKKFTGFELSESARGEEDFPKVCVCDAAASAFSEKGFVKENRVLFTEPYVSHRDIRRLGEMAGCRLCCDAGQILYADNRIAGVFSDKELEGNLRLSQKGDWYEQFSQRLYKNCDKVCLTELSSNFAVFIRR